MPEESEDKGLKNNKGEEEKKPGILKSKIALLLVLAVVGGVVLMIVSVLAMDAYTARPAFCGNTCHNMQKPYKTWKNDKAHFEKDIACVKCHYAPGEKGTLKARFGAMIHLFSYLAYPEDKQFHRTPIINDGSCKLPDCHPTDKYLNKAVRYTNLDKDSKYMKDFDLAKKSEIKYKDVGAILNAAGIPFVHKTHEEKTIEGQKVHCNTCHLHKTTKIHFEVDKEACFLCHFRKAEFNKGRAKCSLCHKIPTEPLQKQKAKEDAAKDDGKKKEEPITHKKLEKNKVPCISCHYVVMGGGDLKLEACFDCHDTDETLALTKKKKITKEDKKLMHEKHIADQNAKCFQCHKPMQHGKVENVLEVIVNDCASCHKDTHIYQRQLLAGNVIEDEPPIPALMAEVNTNCLGCHITLQKDVEKGHSVAKSSDKPCVACHTKRHKAMLKEWKDKIKTELAGVKEVQAEARKALKKARKKLPKAKVAEAQAMYDKGMGYVNIVKFGNGVHNKKYSIVLIDFALNNFEDMIDFLAEGEEGG